MNRARASGLFLLIVGGACFGALLGPSATESHGSESRRPGRVAVMRAALQDGSLRIPFEPVSGYLTGVLKALHVPVESQVAVFSRTSAQADLISPDNPRVIYFSDDIAVGWVRGSSVIEVTESDPTNGAVAFYTVRQDAGATPEFTKTDTCRSCHQSDRTLNVPGLLVLSTPEAYGGSANTFGVVTDHRTPLRDRWGGWYVTGRSSGWRHLGNRIGQGWLLSLYDQFYDDGYPTRYSDAVALMVLEHQTHMTNLLNLLARQFSNGPPADARSTIRELVDYMLFIDEAQLPAPIIGPSGFAQYFSNLGPYDSQGRSLRTFDLKTRLFRYPCSYMIYSESFEALPAVAKDAVYARLFEVLSSSVLEPKYTQLTSEKRRETLQILSETKPEFAARTGKLNP